MKVALQLYSLRDYIKTEDDIRTTLTQVKAIGYDIVQLSGIGKFTQEKVDVFDKITKELGLEIIATHVDFNQLRDDFDQIVKYHQQLGVTYIGIGSMPDPYDRRNLTHYQDFVFEMNKMAKKLHPFGLKLVYHNHAFEFAKIGTFLPMDIITQNMVKTNLSLEPDLYWLQFAGLNPLEFVKKHKDSIDIIHIKDMKIKQHDQWVSVPQFASIGDGNMDYQHIIKELKNMDFPYIIVEQDDFYGADPLVEIINSLKFIQKI
ncbi:MAG: hypothetical protein A2Y45_07820 [Tenericutes bacterium GWC2_34_14]|nr:MAG: hypothetical protein A2Z84_08490 [Tenericutes bacterium GWA2_35_7]OHE29805.1 MAG: hypothetical protein A2Y45_07820 [Tenericutes bacterium GWC2_34_14]OHE34784.1 MAG: hypothetical protein A2012_01430 [Tenericutes bacterium GWE2_34_108]OHE37355.1 MAG: hypothetical protein A2Y46_01580 [Tenericutes bacterium GWF1_35_14]OHE39512.1 MAG: hypothetical protein A2Y44_01280 [Tenericutes bacterium GWF2_35_184]OHE44299.1 MAG: hypothetical protein A2221_04230 [Tenericutes bacterium RIFOXYA2_FULL_36_3